MVSKGELKGIIESVLERLRQGSEPAPACLWWDWYCADDPCVCADDPCACHDRPYPPGTRYALIKRSNLS